jgi:hypothetical protein
VSAVFEGYLDFSNETRCGDVKGRTAAGLGSSICRDIVTHNISSAFNILQDKSNLTPGLLLIRSSAIVGQFKTPRLPAILPFIELGLKDEDRDREKV